MPETEATAAVVGKKEPREKREKKEKKVREPKQTYVFKRKEVQPVFVENVPSVSQQDEDDELLMKAVTASERDELRTP